MNGVVFMRILKSQGNDEADERLSRPVRLVLLSLIAEHS